MELLYADDLVLMAASEELLMEKLRKWKNWMEAKGLRVNAGKTKQGHAVSGEQVSEKGFWKTPMWCL